jgi:hypothetical protein
VLFSILGLLALVLVHREEHITDSEGQLIVDKLILKYSNFRKVNYAQKLMVACLSKLITQSRRTFIVNNFETILKVIIRILSESSSQTSKSAIFDE